MKPVLYIGVVGAGECTEKEASLAGEVGFEIAKRGAVLICGGRGGVMEASAKGARRADGIVIGILPGRSRSESNPFLTIALPTGLGDARNAVITCAADVLIAISGGYGTLSEIGLALKMGKPVVGLSTWEMKRGMQEFAVRQAHSPMEAVETAFLLGQSKQMG
ncbi:MAG: hypothetical protein XD78_1478 [Desulfotomaculum sp. 46_296]|nr:MAG: hypothetical protein XD78_1478 [Desulfotomaculum sp. 46_296]HAU32642.1 TIGR00725 family protein [Desulfotomaculum sp.]